MHRTYSNFRCALSGELRSMTVEDGIVRPFNPGADVIDLGGAYVLPGFVDAHCHILPTGLDLQKLHLGECSTHDEILDLVAERHRQLPEGDWLMAVHYDQTKFPDGQHLTRDQLDKISPARPILLRHVNGHAGIANSAALERAKLGDQSPDPAGGTYLREGGRLNGVLLERALEHVSSAADTPTLDQMVDAILRAGEKMGDLGITCASDMMTGRYDLDLELQAYRIAAEKGCRVRTRLYLQWSSVFGPRGMTSERLEELQGAMDPKICRVAGIKIFADGAIGSATAAIYGTFTGTEDKGKKEDGQLIYSRERLMQMVRTAHEAGYSVAIHSIGDRSTDLVMDAYEALDDPARHRIEHAMLLSDAQIERMHRLGIHCTMQPEFLMRFGHSYKRQLGPERAATLKRMRSVKDAGIPLSFSSDRPIVAGDPWDGIHTAVHRPEGFGQDESVTLREAIEAYTQMGAVANRDTGTMGTLAQGEFADFQVYDHDPLAISGSNSIPRVVIRNDIAPLTGKDGTAPEVGALK